MNTSIRSQIGSFIVMDVMEAARQAEEAGRHIIHMEVGQPSTGAPSEALARLSQMMVDGPLGYTVALGLPALRSRIARHYGETYDVDLNPERVVVTAGASGAFLLAFSALFDNGARVGLGTPCYPSYRHILTALGLEAVTIPTALGTRFQPTPDQITEAALAGLIVASPANPTGTVLDRSAMVRLIETCHAKDIAFISDEIYHGIGESPATSALELSDQTYVVQSFSKYFSMTGWRVGWMVVPENHIRTVERLAQNMFICPPHASQVLALATMDCGEVLNGFADVYRQNRALLLGGLADAGLGRFAPPDGAFYIYVDVSDYTNDSLELSKRILDEAGVAVTPGLDFDTERGHQWMRLSYARSTEDIAEGLRRLKRFFRG